MQVRHGSLRSHPADQPLVVVPAAVAGPLQPVGRLLKQAASMGADVVEVPIGALDQNWRGSASDDLPVVVTCASRDDLDRVVAIAPAAMHWTGPPISVELVRAVGVPLVWTSAGRLLGGAPESGDWLVVPLREREHLESRPSGVVGLVDLGDGTDRAEVAALVALCLEGSSDGFVTVAPTAVRRAAHVIRAVERSR